MIESIITILAFIFFILWISIGSLLLYFICTLVRHWKEFKTLTPAEIKRASQIDDIED